MKLLKNMISLDVISTFQRYRFLFQSRRCSSSSGSSSLWPSATIWWKLFNMLTEREEMYFEVLFFLKIETLEALVGDLLRNLWNTGEDHPKSILEFLPYKLLHRYYNLSFYHILWNLSCCHATAYAIITESIPKVTFVWKHVGFWRWSHCS